jgi:hypothetical protein
MKVVINHQLELEIGPWQKYFFSLHFARGQSLILLEIEGESKLEKWTFSAVTMP